MKAVINESSPLLQSEEEKTEAEEIQEEKTEAEEVQEEKNEEIEEVKSNSSTTNDSNNPDRVSLRKNPKPVIPYQHQG